MNWKNCGRRWVKKQLTEQESRIPLFATDHLTVRVNNRPAPGVLCRSDMMDDALADITDRVVDGWKQDVEGMLYCLYILQGANGKTAKSERSEQNSEAIPIYVGIAKAQGHTGNLSSLFRSSRKKPRFDDYDGYHIGDLSTQVVPGCAKPKGYKKRWSDRMFVNAPSTTPKLRTAVYFWGKPWSNKDISAVSSLGHTSLLLEERILIDALNAAYPEQLLNR